MVVRRIQPHNKLHQLARPIHPIGVVLKSLAVDLHHFIEGGPLRHFQSGKLKPKITLLLQIRDLHRRLFKTLREERRLPSSHPQLSQPIKRKSVLRLSV